MKLKPENIKDFQSIWKKSFGEDISDEDALKEANSLLRIIKIVSTKRMPIKDISQPNLL